MTTPSETRLCDAEGMSKLLRAMATQIIEGRRPGVPLRLVGVRSRGVPLARRIAEILPTIGAANVPVGAVDITLYRDDLGQGYRWPVLLGTEIPFPVDNAEIVLVDDVLFTGRTIRAALNAICDLGRPGRIRLAVLVDRGHREFPIQAEIVGLNVTTERDERVRVRMTPLDPVDEIVRIANP